MCGKHSVSGARDSATVVVRIGCVEFRNRRRFEHCTRKRCCLAAPPVHAVCLESSWWTTCCCTGSIFRFGEASSYCGVNPWSVERRAGKTSVRGKVALASLGVLLSAARVGCFRTPPEGPAGRTLTTERGTMSPCAYCRRAAENGA